MSTRREFLLQTAVAGAVTGVPLTAESNTASALDRSVDAYIRHEMVQRRIPGLALAVIQDGRLQKTASYGYGNLQFAIPVTSTMTFQIASMTKECTSVGVMILVEAGKLKLEDPIGTYLEDLPSKWRGVTIRQLLNCTSGLPDVFDQVTSKVLAQTPKEMLALLRDRRMDFTPGSQWRYNQTNYALLGLLIEKLSGQPYVQFCESRLFAPLKLTRPTFAFGKQTAIEQEATIYTTIQLSTPPKLLDHLEVYVFGFPPMLYPAAGLNISATDFARWLIALMNEQFITKASLEELWTPARLNDGSPTPVQRSGSIAQRFGLSWWLSPQTPHPSVGGDGGGRAAFLIYPKDHLTVIVLTNLFGADDPVSLVEGVAHRYLTSL